MGAFFKKPPDPEDSAWQVRVCFWGELQIVDLQKGFPKSAGQIELILAIVPAEKSVLE
jgi:hypothetical protein